MDKRPFSSYSEFEKVLLFKELADSYSIPEEEKKKVVHLAITKSDALFDIAIQSYMEETDFLRVVLEAIRQDKVQLLLNNTVDFKEILSERDYNNLSTSVISSLLEKIHPTKEEPTKGPILRKKHHLFPFKRGRK